MKAKHTVKPCVKFPLKELSVIWGMKCDRRERLPARESLMLPAVKLHFMENELNLNDTKSRRVELRVYGKISQGILALLLQFQPLCRFWLLQFIIGCLTQATLL